MNYWIFTICVAYVAIHHYLAVDGAGVCHLHEAVGGVVYGTESYGLMEYVPLVRYVTGYAWFAETLWEAYSTYIPLVRYWTGITWIRSTYSEVTLEVFNWATTSRGQFCVGYGTEKSPFCPVYALVADVMVLVSTPAQNQASENSRWLISRAAGRLRSISPSACEISNALIGTLPATFSIVDTTTSLMALVARVYIVFLIIEWLCWAVPTVREWFENHLRMLLEYGKLPELKRYDFNRDAFRDQPMFPKAPDIRTPHPVSAAARTAVAAFMEAVCFRMGRRQYSFQQSRADQRRDIAGKRLHYWGKDLTAETTDGEMLDTDIVTMVDVDYYVDMPKFLSTPKTMLIYTVQPQDVAGKIDNCVFTFSDGRYKAVYDGGSSYEHQLWDYGTDTFCVTTYDPLLGIIPTSKCVYAVDKRQSEDHRMVIQLLPTARYTGIAAWLAHYMLSGQELRHFNPCRPSGVNLLEIKNSEGVCYSMGLAGEYTSERYTPTEITVIRAKLTSTKITPSTPVLAGGLKGSVERGAMLVMILSKEPDILGAREIQASGTANAATLHYEFVGRNLANISEELKQSQIAYMDPLYTGSCAPVKTKNNLHRAINARVTDIQHKVETAPSYDGYVREFVKLIIPTPGVLLPEPLERTYETQTRPMQKHIIHEYEVSDATPLESQVPLLPMMKGESYGLLSDPRVITPYEPNTKIRYGMVIQAMDTFSAGWPWYAFKMKPNGVALRVAALLSGAKTATNSDFSRFDGRYSSVLRDVERAILVRAFNEDVVAEVVELHSRQYNRVGNAGGLRYETKWTRGSGSPETSLFNSTSNAFVAYVAIRSASPHLSPAECYERLGIYGGDDGLTADLDLTVYKQVADNVGCKLTVDSVQCGEPGVTFLSRMYGPEVWFCHASCEPASSTCDIARQLKKMHLTTNLAKFTPLEKLIAKCFAFWLTDSHTPVIGEYVSAVIEQARMHSIDVPAIYERCVALTSYCSRLNQTVEEVVKCYYRDGMSRYEDHPNQYPNRNQDWMEKYASESLVCLDVAALRKWIKNAQEKNVHPSAFLCVPDFNIAPDPAALLTAEGTVVYTLGEGLDVVQNEKPESPKPVAPAPVSTKRLSDDEWHALTRDEKQAIIAARPPQPSKPAVKGKDGKAAAKVTHKPGVGGKKHPPKKK